MINLNDMTHTDFEELCYDLLVKLGFKNISWRKGTGKNGNTADSGRDIEASLIVNDIDNTIYEEKWYIECKHYTRGIPVEKIVNAINWASAEKKDKLLIITSNFLSNSSKQYIEKIKTISPLKIKVWENKELESLLNNHIDLIHKYKINKNLNISELMNPYHITYISCVQDNTLEHFLNVLEKIDKDKRENILDITYCFFADSYGVNDIPYKTSRRKKVYKRRKIYSKFINKCRESLKTTSDIFLVNSLVNFTLQILFYHGVIINLKLPNVFYQKKYQKYELYNYFCNNVVAELLENTYL